MTMRSESIPRRPDRLYKVTTICNGTVEEQVLTRQERDRLDPSDVDVHIDETKREVFVTLHNRGKGVNHPPCKAHGLGAYVWELLSDVVFAAGEFVPLGSDASTNTRVSRLRRAFGDLKIEQWFFVTTSMPYQMAINTDRSWRFIESLAE